MFVHRICTREYNKCMDLITCIESFKYNYVYLEVHNIRFILKYFHVEHYFVYIYSPIFQHYTC